MIQVVDDGCGIEQVRFFSFSFLIDKKINDPK